MTVRVRFAPSPTGYLHIGSARTALYNYLFAKKLGGKFLLRIEDTDLARSTEESTRSILEGMAWIGLEHDEEIVFQSDNADKHREAAQRLLAEGKAYRDFTPKEASSDKSIKEAIAERARQQQHAKNMRDNPFRDLPAEESDRRATAGDPFAIRLKVPETGKTVFEDAVYGLQERDYAETEDLVLLRSDGHPLYNLAVVCDDIEMNITHVIRGQDHLTNTHKQILIYQALGQAPPKFGHLPLILAPNKSKLSKRKHGEIVSLTTYRDAGFVPAAFGNFLALLGWSAGGEKEIYSLDELVEKFSLDGVHRSSAVFNFKEDDPRHWTDDKALWMNAEYIRTMPLAGLLPLVKTELKSAKLWREEYESELRALDATVPSTDAQSFESEAAERPAAIALEERMIGDHDWYVRTVDLVRARFFTLKDFSTQGRAYFSEDYDFDPAAVAKNLSKFPELETWLPELAVRFEAAFAHQAETRPLGRVPRDTTKAAAFTESNIETLVKQFTEEKNIKLGVIMNGARTLLTGVAVGPSMLAVFEAIGLERTVARLKSRLAWNR
ncbi:MAG: glutamate--tRNA ligase [Acidobacteria bacterium]|nr:glutamate--tRNA ligase [Acidobacteriota bacterium]MCA1608503.1 glutamate--tRNA ligase [Acidobacteriota bacterium]